MPTPSTPESAWVTGVRWNSRTTTATTATTSEAISDAVRALVATYTTTKTRPGAVDSPSPRTPPIASANEKSSPIAARSPRAAADPSTGLGSPSGNAPSAPASLTGPRRQLVGGL